MAKSEITVLVVGILMIVIGMAFRIYVSRNRFYRRGEGGLQRFSSYRKSVIIPAFETMLRIIGTLLVIGGLSFCFAVWYNSHGVKRNNSKKISDTTVVTAKKSSKKSR
ncbi:hypothetical protein [Chitinophaga polysaccharea]|uniref:hypothetical protein n=1 Tax=Chitinophaga polysaccharea TaxID=1293035 RepID=UPI00115AE379|nr:hypothetical protein [Chitinophaga polysaccharea]